MSRAHKIANLVGVLFPLIAFVVAIVLLWHTWVGWSDLAVLAIMYVVCGYGVTLGFHRLLTHRSFQTFKPVEYALAALGSMAVQGPVDRPDGVDRARDEAHAAGLAGGRDHARTPAPEARVAPVQ